MGELKFGLAIFWPYAKHTPSNLQISPDIAVKCRPLTNSWRTCVTDPEVCLEYADVSFATVWRPLRDHHFSRESLANASRLIGVCIMIA